MRFCKFDVFLVLVIIAVVAIIAHHVADLPLDDKVFRATCVVVDKSYSPAMAGMAGKVAVNNPAFYTITVMVDGHSKAMSLTEDFGEAFRVGQTVKIDYKLGWLTKRVHPISVTPAK